MRLLKFSDFSYIHTALPLGLKPGFNTNCLSPQARCLNECFFLYQTKSLFWPTSSCQIVIKCSFLESLWHKKTNCTSFARKKLQIFCKQPVKGNLHIFSFSWSKIRLVKILQKFLHIWNGMVKGFSKMYNFSYFGQIFFLQTFLLYNWILRGQN